MTRNPYYSGAASENFDGLHFFNPGQPDTDRPIGDLLRWKWEATAATWPRHVSVRPQVPDERVAGLRVTTVGHATMLIQAANLNILTDRGDADRLAILRLRLELAARIGDRPRGGARCNAPRPLLIAAVPGTQ